MKITDVSLMLTKYKIAEFKLLIPGLTVPFPIESKFISDIIIEKDFDNLYFPYFQTKISIPIYIYRLIRKNPNQIRAFIKFQYAYFREPQPETNDLPSFSSYINSNFFIYIEDMSPDLNEETLVKHERDEETYNKSMGYGEMKTLNILLYREDYLQKSKKIINKILTSTTLIDAITVVLNESGLSQVLISPPISYKSYKQFIITPIPAMDQLYRICNEYRLHSSGTSIFFDFKNIYILDKKPGCSAYVNNEHKTTYISSPVKTANVSLVQRGCYSNPIEKYNYINIIPETLDIKSQSELHHHVYGNDFINIDNKTGAIVNHNVGTTPAIGSVTEPTRILITERGEDISNAIKQRAKESSTIVTVGFSYINLDMLDPNKEFILLLDDARYIKYNKSYRISKMICIFQKEGDYFIPHVTVELKG